MRPMDREKARRILLDEFHLTPVNADLILKNFPELENHLADAVEQWLDNRSVADVEVEGLSIKEIMRLQRCHFLVAVKNLSRLMDQSLPPEKRKRLREIYGKPVIIE